MWKNGEIILKTSQDTVTKGKLPLCALNTEKKNVPFSYSRYFRYFILDLYNFPFSVKIKTELKSSMLPNILNLF